MVNLFMMILNLSLTASTVILAVILIRLLLKRSPRIFSYLLWGIVFFRLVCPFSIKTDFGIIPDVKISGNGQIVQIPGENVPSEADMMQDAASAAIAEPVSQNDDYTGDGYADISESAKVRRQPVLESVMIRMTHFAEGISGQVWRIVSVLWLIGLCGYLCYGAISYLRLLQKLRKITAGQNRRNVQNNLNRQNKLNGRRKTLTVISNQIEAPFTIGFLNPVIYLPAGLEKSKRELVLTHEMIHIRRRDYLIKPLAWLILCIHWFNPLVWLSFVLMERDMETSCDEAVLKKAGYKQNKDYARTLLDLSEKHMRGIGCPTAFGEINVKARIKNALKQKKTKAGIVIISAFIVCAAAVLLLVNSNGNANTLSGVTEAEREEGNAADAGGQEQAALSEEVSGNREEFSGQEESSDITEEVSGLTEDISQQEEELRRQTEETKEQGGETRRQIEETEGQNEENGNTDIAQQEENWDGGQDTGAGEKLESSSDGILRTDGNSDIAYVDVEILFSYPVTDAAISAAYGVRVHPVLGTESYHSGIDFAAESGTPVLAAADGTVYETGYDSDCGNYVIIRHANGNMTYYAQCKDILTAAGTTVSRGDQIATVGSTGNSTGPHLHFAVSRNGEWIEPVFSEE